MSQISQKQKLLVISSIIGASFFIVFFAFAQQTEPPATEGTAFMASISLPVRVVKIEITSEPGAQEITGKFAVWNEGTSYVSGIGYVMDLISGTDLSKEFPLKSEIKNDVFNLGPDAVAWQNFSFTIPLGINSGTYTFQITTIDSRGLPLGWQTKVMELVGENRFLKINFESVRVLYPIPSEEQLKFVVDSIGLPEITKVGDVVEVPALFGPIFFEFPPLPKVKFVVTNPARTEILAVPHIVIREDTHNGEIVQEFDKESLTFQPNEIKTVILEMPELLTPKSYHASVYFLSDNQLVSSSANFIWVVGGASAKIFNIRANQDLFKKGEIANIALDITGAADGATIIKDSSFTVKIEDGQGTLCGQKELTGALIPAIVTLSISVPIEKDCFNPQITAEIQKDNQILDSKTLNIQTTSAAPPEVKPFSLAQKIAFSILIVIIIILVIMIIYFLVKKRKPSLTALLLFIFSSILLFSFASQVQAAKVCGIEAGPSVRTIDGINLSCVGGTSSYYWQADRAISQTEAQNTAPDFQPIYGNGKNVRLYNPQGKDHLTPTIYASYWVINTTGDNGKITLQSYQWRFPKDATLVIDGITYTAKVLGASQYLFPSRAISQTEAQNTADDLKQIFGNNVNVRLYNPQGKFHSNPTIYASYWIINTTADNRLISLKNIPYRFYLNSIVTLGDTKYDTQFYSGAIAEFTAKSPISDSIVQDAIYYLEEIYGHNNMVDIWDWPLRDPPLSPCKNPQIFKWRMKTDSTNSSGGKIFSSGCQANNFDLIWNNPVDWNFNFPKAYVQGSSYSPFSDGRFEAAHCSNAYGEIWINVWLEDTSTPDPDDWIAAGNYKLYKGRYETRGAMFYRSGSGNFSGIWQIPSAGFSIPQNLPSGFAKVKVDAFLTYDIGRLKLSASYDETRTICIGPSDAFDCTTSLPDLAVESPAYLPLSPNAGSPMTFTGIVKNIGTYNAGSSQTELSIDGVEQVITSTDVLGIQGTETEIFAWTPPKEGVYTFQICADARNDIIESDETNNCSSPMEFTVSGPPPADHIPSAIKLNSTPVDCCFHTDVGGSFSWTFSDSDPGDSQDAYQVQVDKDSDFNNGVMMDSCVLGEYVLGNTCEPGHASDSFVPAGRPFAWNTYYYWRVKIKDSTGNWSDWAYPPNDPANPPFPTSSAGVTLFDTGDPWPWPEFSYDINGGAFTGSCSQGTCHSTYARSPNPFLNILLAIDPVPGLLLQNLSETLTQTNPHPAYCAGKCNYTWSFGDDTPPILKINDTSPTVNPTTGLPMPYVYPVKGDYQVRLHAENKTVPTHSCDLYMNLMVGVENPPEWHEIPPFSMIEGLIAGAFDFLNF